MWDSIDTEETLGRGGVQFMTAGRGIRHSEHNLHDEPLRFIQCWVVPRRPGATTSAPRRAATQKDVKKWSCRQDFEHRSVKAPVQIQQDCNIYVSELQAGRTPEAMRIDQQRQGYLLCVEGSVQLVDSAGKVRQMHQHDAAELKGSVELTPTAGANGAFLLLFEMAKSHHSRSDV
eukprot:g30950.t1